MEKRTVLCCFLNNCDGFLFTVKFTGLISMTLLEKLTVLGWFLHNFTGTKLVLGTVVVILLAIVLVFLSEQLLFSFPTFYLTNFEI